MENSIEGAALARLSEWLTTNLNIAPGSLQITLIAGGRSNLTYRVTDSLGDVWVLRRPPMSHVLETAHDVVREFTVISALGRNGLPVPNAIALCTDEEIIGSPFYVMEYVNGHILQDSRMASTALSLEARGLVGPNLALGLAELHLTDPEEVGLGDLARHDGYIERQIGRWTRQYAQTKSHASRRLDLVERVGAALSSRIPLQQRVSIVHGDYRLDNIVIDDDGRVLAILDWEMCTLGDPLADIGLLCVYWADPVRKLSALIGQDPTSAPGFSTRQQVLAAYSSASKLDTSQIDFYMAFGYWKLACILQGVFARYTAGAGAGDERSVETFPEHIGTLAEVAEELLGSIFDASN